MSKRAKFAIVSVLLSLALGILQFVNLDVRFSLIMSLGAVSYILIAWVLFEDLKGAEWISLLVLPVMFVLGAGFFSYYLPEIVPNLVGLRFDLNVAKNLAVLVKFIYFVLVAVGLYAIILTENIFSVASIRTIQLIRAARSVGFIMTLVVAIFFFHTILSLRLSFGWIGLFVFIVSLSLGFAGLWSVDLKGEKIKDIYLLSVIIAIFMAQLSIVLAFWPIKAFMGALVLVSGFYSLLGLFQQRLASRIYLGGYLEYVIFSIIVLMVSFFTTSWR